MVSRWRYIPWAPKRYIPEILRIDSKHGNENLKGTTFSKLSMFVSIFFRTKKDDLHFKGEVFFSNILAHPVQKKPDKDNQHGICIGGFWVPKKLPQFEGRKLRKSGTSFLAFIDSDHKRITESRRLPPLILFTDDMPKCMNKNWNCRILHGGLILGILPKFDL